MEKLLALFFNDDFLKAAVQPIEGNFSIISPSGDNKYSFYFKVNPYSQQIEAGAEYEKKFRDKQKLFLGDLIKNIEAGNSFNVENFSQDYLSLFDCIIRSIKNLYADKIRLSDPGFPLNDNTVINAVAVFSENFSDNVKRKITNYFKEKNIMINSTQNIDCLAVKYFAKTKGLFCQNRKFAVLETLGDDLNISIVKADNKTFTREQFKKFKGYGIDPLVKVTAEKIVQSVNQTEHIIAEENKEEITAETIRHYDKAASVIKYFEQNPQKSTIKISTVFACKPDYKISVSLSFDDLKNTAYDISRQYPAFFTNSFLSVSDIKISSLENVILIGTTFNNQSVLQELTLLANTKIQHFNDTDSEHFLTAIFDFTSPQNAAEEVQDEEATAFMFAKEEEKPPVHQEPVYKEVNSIQITTLNVGQHVYIDTFDATPGKGAAFQEFETLGGGMFKVLSSGRSLKPGDIAQSVYDVWKPEMQLDFIVTRGAKNLGKFRTRVVKKIRVK